MGKRLIICAVVLALLAASCAQTGGPPADGGLASAGQKRMDERERICFEFLTNSMITEQGGVRTNYLDKAKNAELATGAEVLSESMGLLMLYAAELRDEALFQRSLRFVEEYLDTGRILSYRYSPASGAYGVNAFVDDIRIVRALLMADEAFGGGYLDTALDYADRLYDTNVKDGLVYDMYDEVHGTTNDFITLCYIDLDTLQQLSEHDPRWEEVFESMRNIVAGGYISDTFPLYAGAFSYAAAEYSKNDVSMVQSALTALSLAGIGECPQRTLDYLKDCLESGAIYGTYRQDGAPADDTESTATYAICAMLAKAVRDDEMYGLCIDRMNRFQVTDKTSEVYGAFANAKTMDLYAFDNLNALLAYRQGVTGMFKRVFATLLIAAVLMALPPVLTANAGSGQVLLVYNDKEAMAVISGLIEACGMIPEPVDSVKYTSGMAESYDYVVLQDEGPLRDVLQLGKKVVCLGDSFAVMPGIEIDKADRVLRAQMNVYGNTQSVIVDPGTAYIADYSGEAVGSISLCGGDYPLGVMGDEIMYAPYLSADDLSVFAVAKMLNRYFGRQDGGKMFVMIDEVYPFDDIDMLELTADKLYENGIPFIMSVMPVYYNTEYPSFTRYANALRYIQSKSGSLIMHDPLVTGNELVGESLDARMEKAYATFEENGVHVFDAATFPYEVSLDMLSAIQPQNQLFVSLPIDTVVRFDVFRDEAELDAAIAAINRKWLQIGDYRRYFTDVEYRYQEEPVDDDYTYRETEEQRYAFLVDAGNQVLLVVVLVSAGIIIGLTLLGYRLYREKFLKKGK